MPIARGWTAEEDAAIRSGRGSGLTWEAIAAAMGLNRNTVIERGRRINAARGDVNREARYAQWAAERARERQAREPMETDRPPLPAGHALTWGLLSSQPYPYALMGMGNGPSR